MKGEIYISSHMPNILNEQNKQQQQNPALSLAAVTRPLEVSRLWKVWEGEGLHSLQNFENNTICSVGHREAVVVPAGD